MMQDLMHLLDSLCGCLTTSDVIKHDLCPQVPMKAISPISLAQLKLVTPNICEQAEFYANYAKAETKVLGWIRAEIPSRTDLYAFFTRQSGSFGSLVSTMLSSRVTTNWAVIFHELC